MLAPWRSALKSAIHRNRSKPYSRYFQLATITPEGLPANRTVVFRGFLDDENNQLKIVTDLRSSKIRDIEHQSQGSACWYFTKTREQFRILGQLQLVTATETDSHLQKARKTTWYNLSEPARSQFAWPDPAQPAADPSAFEIEPPNSDTPLDNFCLLLLTPRKVDLLQLKSEPQKRYLYTQSEDSTWEISSINP